MALQSPASSSFTMVTVYCGATTTFSGQVHHHYKRTGLVFVYFLWCIVSWSYMSYRINLPKRRPRLAAEEEEGEGNIRNGNSSEQLDADGDTASEVSSEVSFSYEFAQTEVMMKALGSNGETKTRNNKHCVRTRCRV